MICGVVIMPKKKSRPNIAKSDSQRTLPTTTIIMTVLLLAASAWATGQGYPNAGQMLMLFGVVGAITVTIPMATDDKFIHITVTLGSMFFMYYLMQDMMIAGFDELMDLMLNMLIGAAIDAAPIVP